MGAAAFLVNQCALLGLYELPPARTTWETPAGALNVSLFVASALALELSIVVRFALNDRWTFHDHRGGSLLRRFWQSNVGSLSSQVLMLGAINSLTPTFGVSYLIANAIGAVAGLAWNWAWSIRVVWRGGAMTRRQPPTGAPSSSAGVVIPVPTLEP